MPHALPKEVNEEGEERNAEMSWCSSTEYKMYKYMSYELRDFRMNEASRSVYKEPTFPREVLEYRTPVDTSSSSQISREAPYDL